MAFGDQVKQEWSLFKPVWMSLLLNLVLLTCFRLLIVWRFGAGHVSIPVLLTTLSVGFRFDLAIAGWVAILPVFCLMLAPPTIVKRSIWFPVIYSPTLSCVIIFLECATIPFMAEYDLRPNRLMLEYLGHPFEVFATIWDTHALYVLLVATLIVVGWRLLYGWQRRLYSRPTYQGWPGRLTAGFVLLTAAVLCVRGFRVLGRPLGANDAAFSSQHLVNEFALNSAYTLGNAAYALSFEKQVALKLYEPVGDLEVIERAIADSTFADTGMVKNANPLMHQVKPRVERKRPLNFVIILEESMGAEFVGFLGGKPLTPNLDRLAKKGLAFTRLYSTGTRSARGIEALISGFLPTQSMSVIKLGLAQRNFFTVATLLAEHGYATSFIYGGNSGFDNMRMFSLNNGFDQVIDERDYEKCAFKGIWGCSDEDLFAKANDWFIAQGDKPFFSLVFTSSNHGPFEYPDGRITPFETPKGSVHNTVKYADYALGKYFSDAEKEAYFSNTIFLVVADHNWKSRGPDLVPIESMRIPGLIMGPGIKPEEYSKPVSQIDLVPTILPELGFSMMMPMIGHDIRLLKETYPGRAILQFDRYNAFMRGDDVFIHGPDIKPSQFIYDGQRLHPRRIDAPLARLAAAYALLPSLLYKNQLYEPFKSGPQTTLHKSSAALPLK